MAVLEAAQPSDLDVKVRNKLYAAMERVFNNADAEKVHVSGAVCARYAENVKKAKSRSRQDLFFMLKEFVADPTCLTMKFTEKHVRESIKFSSSEYAWVTRVECMIMFQGHVWEQGRLHAEKLLAASKTSKPHPMAPTNPELRLHKILKAMFEGESKLQKSSQAIFIDGEVTSSDAAKSVMEAMGGKPAVVDINPDKKQIKTDQWQDQGKQRKWQSQKG